MIVGGTQSTAVSPFCSSMSLYRRLDHRPRPRRRHDGGRIVFEGTPAGLVAARSTLTGEHLANYVGA